MTKVKIEVIIEGKTNYVRERYAKQLYNMYNRHDFKEVTIYKLPKAVRVVARE